MIVKRISNLFKTLSGVDRADYIALLCIAATVPIAWRLAMWAMIAFTVTSVVQLCVSRQLGWKTTTTGQRVLMALMVLFFIIYLISGSQSVNQSYGWSTTEGKLPFVLFPLTFVLADKRYLTRDRLRLIFYLLWAVLTIRFLVELIAFAVKVMQGDAISSLIGENFSQLHHTYYALYAMVGAAFLYSDLMRRIERCGWDKRCWWLLLAAVPPIATVVVTDSRTGIICAALLIAVGLLDYVVSQRKWKLILVGALLLIAAVAVYQVIPSNYQRFSLEIKALRTGQESERMIMLRSAAETAAASPLWGYGSGDYEEPLQQQYLRNGYAQGLERQQGSHNQYLETMLECGIFGTLTLVAMLVVPVVTALRRKTGRRFVVSSIMVIAITIFFESMLGRQMGIIFFCFVLSMLMLFIGRTQEYAPSK